MCLIRSLKTRKYADYYLFLEEVISLFSRFQIQKLETDLFVANFKKVMDLQDKDKHDQLCIIKRPDTPKYRFKEIRGQIKHINKVLKENNFKTDDVFLQLNVPSGVNFYNKVKEDISIQRERVYIDKNSGETFEEDEITQDREYRVSTTNNFNIIGMTEEQFRSKIQEVYKSRFL